MSQNNSTDRNTQRNTLLDNGYHPLPLAAKGCFIKGWSTREITAEWLQEYARIAKYPNTGIRCDNLIAFDIDVLDEQLADTIEGYIEARCGETEFCRIGRWPKRLLVYRAKGKGPYRKTCSARYDVHRIELLSGHGCQFAAFGQHPETRAPYKWEGLNPLTTAHKKLKALDYDHAVSVLNECEKFFQDAGLEQTSGPLAWGLSSSTEYDLTDSFECLVDGEVITWGELKPTLDKEGVFGNIRREDDEFGDSSACHFMIAHGSGQPAIHDFVRDCTHYDSTITPELAEVLPELPDGDMFTPDFVDELLNEWVFVGFDNTVRHVDDPQRAYPLPNFKNLKAHWQIEVPAAGGKTKLIPAVDGWMKSSDAMRTKYAAMRPDSSEIIVGDVFNTYAPPDHSGYKGGSTKLLHQFLEHLFPKGNELELFLDWHALKFVHPEYRMHGMVTVTPAYGTGRGTWAQILAKLFGTDYVRRIELKDLTGTGSQSAYNDYLADSLVVYVPEALEEKEDQHRWTSRHLAYERLKSVIELQAGPMRINRKYGRNSTETVYSSLLISSNHTDALAIEPSDRRIIVLDNGEEMLPEGHGIHEWLEQPSNIAALASELTDRASDAARRYNPFGMPPMTPAKERMIEAGQSDTDRAYDYMLDAAPGDIVTPRQWAAFAHQARLDWQLDLPGPDLIQKALNAVIQKRARRCEGIKGNKLKASDGSSQRPWIIRNFEHWRHHESEAAIRAEMDKNGSVQGNVTPFTSKSKSD